MMVYRPKSAGRLLSDLDRRILAGLAIHGRASWAQLARALGATESTVARHGQRLLNDNIATVIGMADPMRCGLGQSHWVYLQCSPGAMSRIARCLADRADTRLVVCLSGAYDVVAEFIVPNVQDLARVLDDEVGQMDGITVTSTGTVLRNFKLNWDWATQVLDDDVVANLRAQVPAPTPAASNALELDPDDLRLLNELAMDGRRSNVELAERLKASESLVSRRVARLVSQRAVAFAPQVNPALLGFHLEAFIRLRVDLDAVEKTAMGLSKYACVRYVSAVTGTSDVVCEVVLTDLDALYAFTTQDLSAFREINSVDTLVELRSLKRAFRPMAGDSLDMGEVIQR